VDVDVAAVFDDGLRAADGHGGLGAHLRQGAGHGGHGAQPGQLAGRSHPLRHLGGVVQQGYRHQRGQEFGVAADVAFEFAALVDHGAGDPIKGRAGDPQVGLFPGKGAVDAHGPR
jgi:hypothetical protein